MVVSGSVKLKLRPDKELIFMTVFVGIGLILNFNSCFGLKDEIKDDFRSILFDNESNVVTDKASTLLFV